MGLLDVLRLAHELREVRDPSPLVTYGLDRLLLAVVQDRIDPHSPSDWVAFYRTGRIEPMMIDRIRQEDGDRFNLFDASYPFYQTGDVPLELGGGIPTGEDQIPKGTGGRDDVGQKLKPVGYLRAEVPTATNVTHFRHVSDETQAHCPACAARGLVTLAPFAQSGGSGIKPSINGNPPVYAWLTGRTLFESLALNVTLPGYRPKAAATQDGPSWRGSGVVAAKGERDEVGFLESLTWQPRRIRLFPGAGGPCSLCGRAAEVLVREMVYEQGWSRPKEATWWRDPSVSYEAAKDRPPRALRLREDRSLWRDYATLSLKSQARTPAAIVEQAALLTEIGAIDESSGHPLECYGLLTDGKAKVFEWRCERLPFSPRLISEPDRGATVERALETAERLGDLLRMGLKKLYPRDGGGNRKALDGLIGEVQRTYWATLEGPFRELVLGLDDTSTDPEGLEIDWNRRVGRAARDSFESGVDDFDSDARALRRASEARRLFYGRLKKLVPQPAEDIPTRTADERNASR